MSYYYSKDDYIGRYGWDTSNHKEEAEEITRTILRDELQDTINQIVEEKVTRIWNDAIGRLVHAITYDVNTCVEIAMNNANDIFHSSKAQKFISDSIVKSLISELKSINPIIIK